MDNVAHKSFNALDRSFLAIIKKEIHNIAIEGGFDSKKTGEIDIIVAEMTSNLIKHANGGEILVKLLKNHNEEGIEIICIDNGAGMADPTKMVEDGMSTTNTLGHGLGSIKRFSDIFQIYSIKDWGTIILSRVFRKQVKSKSPNIDIRQIVVAKPGEELSGDGYYTSIAPDQVRVFLGDGLGHGPEAHKAVNEAVKALHISPDNQTTDILRWIHQAVKKTRGLVGSIAIFNMRERKWQICGIGNINTRMQTALSAKNYIAYNGIIGMNIPNTMKSQEILHEHGQILIMCSDGIKTRWEISKYPMILKYDLSILAAAIYKDFGRKTDDMSVLVSRINSTL